MYGNCINTYIEVDEVFKIWMANKGYFIDDFANLFIIPVSYANRYYQYNAKIDRYEFVMEVKNKYVGDVG